MKVIYLGAYEALHPNFDVVYQDINGKRDLGRDMMDIDLTPYDVIIATPPCNFWSIARGNRCSQYSFKCITDNFVIFCGTEQISEIRDFYDCKGYTTRLLIWQKNNPSPMNGEKVYLSGIECAVYAKKPKGTFNAFCKNTVFKHNSGVKDIHETQKPLSLWYELLNDLTNEGDLVLDACMGSFTTAVACHKINRRYIGCELDKDYFDKGMQRLNKVKSQISIFD